MLPGRRLVDRDPGQEMVDVAVRRVDRNSRHRRPRQAVQRACCRRCRSPGSQTGTGSPARRRRPCRPRRPRPTGARTSACCRRRRAPGRWRRACSRPSSCRRRSSGTSYCAPPLSEYGTMTLPFGCTTGWPPRPEEQPGEQHRAPGDAAVGRRDHPHRVAGAVVVELDVAVAVVRARGPRVAGDPGLVPEAPRRLSGVDGIRPGQAAVGRAVDEQDVAAAAGVDPEAEGEPDVVLRVVGDRRVADPRPRAALR